MSDFTQTMKDWRRMCKKFSRRECCQGCPLDGFVEGNCDGIYSDEFADNVDWDRLALIIEDWAKENPELKYPTWRQWLSRQGLVNFRPYWSPSIPTGNTTITYLSSKALEPIPADIAEKLEIDPEKC